MQTCWIVQQPVKIVVSWLVRASGTGIMNSCHQTKNLPRHSRLPALIEALPSFCVDASCAGHHSHSIN